ncbi:o-succinylbenzoate--CoA ligase [Sesbania bispinosa]|nr:o-succinylbenzoate--CoA ligase [Sesbania bispinosa]
MKREPCRVNCIFTSRTRGRTKSSPKRWKAKANHSKRTKEEIENRRRNAWDD